MKKLSIIYLLLLVISCKNETTPLRYADVAEFSNDVVHLTDASDFYYPLHEILEKHKGNIIYVNYWNSYTPYSIDLMPALEQLEDALSGQAFTIINISTDKAMAPFKRHLKITTLDNNYLARNYDDSNFFKEKQIITPRFMIYDKDGKLIDDNAMRPDNDNLKETLEVLIAN